MKISEYYFSGSQPIVISDTAIVFILPWSGPFALLLTQLGITKFY